MKLKWTKKADGSEVAGPFTVWKSAFPCPYPFDLRMHGELHNTYRTRTDAKRAAQRIADSILRNMEGK